MSRHRQRLTRPLQRRFRSLLHGLQPLEERRLMAVTSSDLMQIQVPVTEYRSNISALVDQANPALRVSDSHFGSYFDFGTDAVGDQSIYAWFQQVGGAYRLPEALAVTSDQRYEIELAVQSPAGQGELPIVIDMFDNQRLLIGSRLLVLQQMDPLGVSASEVVTRYRGLLGSEVSDLNLPSLSLLPGTSRVELRWAQAESPLAVVRFGFLDDGSSIGMETVAWKGSELLTSQRSDDAQQSDQRYRIDPSQAYQLAIQATRLTPNVESQKHSVGYVAYDEAGNAIEAVHVVRYPTAVDTRLAAPLNPGDTFIDLVDATGWSNSSSDPLTRSLAWYGYKNSLGEEYAEYTYTRNTQSQSQQGMWSQGGITGNRITLNQPWSGPALAANAAIRNADAGGSLFANLLDQESLTENSVVRSRQMQGTWVQGVPSPTAFPPGTHRIAAAVRLNQSSLAVDESLQLVYQIGRSATVASQVNSSQRQVAIPVLANDSLPTGTRIESTTDGRFGTVTIVRGSNGGSDSLQYVPDPHFIGVDRFTYTVIDPSNLASRTEEVTVRVVGGNLESMPSLQSQISASTATPDSAIVLPSPDSYWTRGGMEVVADGSQYPGLLEGASNGGMPLAVSLVEGPRYGVLSLRPDGTFRYQADTGYVGRDVFSYRVHNGQQSVQRLAMIDIVATAEEATNLAMQRLFAGLQTQVASQARYFYPTNPAYFDAQGNPYLSWRVHLLPYLGYEGLYQRFHLDEPWDSANNLPLLDAMPSIFRDPAQLGPTTTTRFLPLENIDAVPAVRLLLNRADFAASRLLPADMTDGKQNTILLSVAGQDKAIEWTKPTDLPFLSSGPKSSLGTVGDFVTTLFADGTLRRVPLDISETLWSSLASVQEATGLVSPSVPNLGREWAARADTPETVQDYDQAIGDGYLKQVTEALRQQAAATGNLTPASTFPRDSNNQPFLSWRVYLLPYLGYQSLFDQFKLDEPWDSLHNLPLADQMPDVFRSPGELATSTTTRLRWLAGEGAPFTAFQATGSPLTLAQFTDGLDTFLVVEAGTDRGATWTQPETLSLSTDPWASLGTFANGQMRVGLADGRVLAIPTNLPLAELIPITTHQAQEGVDNDTTLRRLAGIPTSQQQRFQQLSKAWLAYVQANQAHPSNGPMPGFTEPVSWRVKLLPYLGETGIYAQYRFDEAWDSPHNQTLLASMPEVYRAANASLSSGNTQIKSVVGNHAILDPTGVPRLPAEITDQASGLLVAIEWDEAQAIAWTKPEDAVDETLVAHLLASHNLLGLWADGSVRNGDVDLNNEARLRQVLIDDKTRSVVSLVSPAPTPIQEGGAISALIFDASSGLSPLVWEVDSPAMVQFVQVEEPVSLTNPSLSGDRRWRVSLSAVDNAVLDGVRTVQLRVGVRSIPGDDASPLTILRTIPLTILDNEALQLSLSQELNERSSSQLTVTRSVTDVSQALEIRLFNSAPDEFSSPVTVTIPAGESSVTVSLAGVEDFVADGNQSVMLTAEAPGYRASVLPFQVLDVNYDPTIATIAAQSTKEDTATADLNVDISDLETPAAQLVVTVESNNLTLVPTTGMELSGTGGKRKLKVTPAANAFGEAIITLRVSDGTNSKTTQFTLTVTPIADTPRSLQVEGEEDVRTAPFTLQANPLDGPEVTHFRISGIVGGTLYRAGESQAIQNGDYLSTVDASAGLEFLSLPNFSGQGSFLIQASQDGSTVSEQSDTATATLQIAGVNDRPSSAPFTASFLEDTPLVLSLSQFAFTDEQDTPANTLAGVRIIALPASGILTNNGQPVSANEIVTRAAIQDGRLVYTPGLNGNGVAYATMAFQVQDDGGSERGGNPFSLTHTATFDVTARNDPPRGANRVLSTIEDTSYTVQLNDFGFQDPDDSPQNALFVVRVESIPLVGSLELNRQPVAAGQVVTRTDILAGLLRYTPPNDVQGQAIASFTFRVQDNGGTSNGGVDLDVQARTLVIDIAAANDAPVGQKVSRSELEDRPFAIALADLGFSDPKDTPSDTLLWVRIASLPTSGTLQFNGVPVSLNQVIAASDIVAEKLRYIPADEVSGNAVATIAFDLRDSGGPEWSAIPGMLTIGLAPVNDPPLGSDGAVNVTEDTAFTFTLANFPITDPKDSPAHSLRSVRITGLPTGSLTFEGQAVTVDQVILASDITLGKFKYQPELNLFGPSLDRFLFQVQDGGGVADQGSDTDPTTRTMTLHVAAVLDAPVLETVETTRDTLSGPIVILPNPVDGNVVTQFEIVRIEGGSLFLATSPWTTPLRVGQKLTLQQGQDGIRFLPDLGRTQAGIIEIASSNLNSTTPGVPATASIAIQAGTPSSTSITLSRNTLYQGVAGAWIGELKAVDSQFPNRNYQWTVLDDRFRIEGQQLFLKSDTTITQNVGTTLLVQVVAVPEGANQAISKTIELNVVALPSGWTSGLHNFAKPNDVNGDGLISPLDALLVINELNLRGSRTLPVTPPGTADPFFFDASGDGTLSPLDALLIINFLNLNGSTSGEGEGPEEDVASQVLEVLAQDQSSPDRSWLAAWSSWQEEQQRRQRRLS